MLRWITARLGRDRRPQLRDEELAEKERIRREADQDLLRAEARAAEQRAPLDGHRGGDSLGGW